MKGIMFNVFGKLVEEKFGLAVWILNLEGHIPV